MTPWPKLDYAADTGTIETLHLLLQLIGKLPLRLHPWLNHGWHVALRITARGAQTRSMPVGGRSFAVELDFLDGAIVVSCDRDPRAALPVAGKTIADVHGELSALLAGLGLPAPLHGAPNEIPIPSPSPEIAARANGTPMPRAGCTARSCGRTGRSRSSARFIAARLRPASCSGAAWIWRSRAFRAAGRLCIRAAFPTCPMR